MNILLLLMKRVKSWFKTTFYFLTSIVCVKNANLLNSEQTVKEVLQNSQSIIRFGDGEFNIIAGNGIEYQKYSRELQGDLIKIADDFISGKDKGYLLSFPTDFFKCNGLKLLKRRVYISSWSQSRKFFKENYDYPIKYGNAFLFSKEDELIYKDLWKNKEIQGVVFVHNNEKYAKSFSEKYEIQTKYVQVPSKNSYEIKNGIYKNIIETISSFNSKEVITLISAGPCGKVLVKELADNGYLAYDTGHCWDTPLETIKDG